MSNAIDKPLVFLKEVEVDLKRGRFKAWFTNGATSASHECSSFFLLMQDRKVTSLDEVLKYIKLGERLDMSVNWAEIKRVFKTFTEGEAHAERD